MRKEVLDAITSEEIMQLFKSYVDIFTIASKTGSDKEAAAANRKILQLLPYIPTQIKSAYDYGYMGYHRYTYDLTKPEVMAPQAFKTSDPDFITYYNTGILIYRSEEFVALPWELTKEEQEEYDKLTAKCEEAFNQVRSGQFIIDRETERLNNKKEKWAKALRQHQNAFVKYQVEHYTNTKARPARRFLKHIIYAVAENIRSYMRKEIAEGTTKEQLAKNLEILAPSLTVPLCNALRTLCYANFPASVSQFKDRIEARFSIRHFSTADEIKKALSTLEQVPSADSYSTGPDPVSYLSGRFPEITFKVLQEFISYLDWGICQTHTIQFLAYQEACQQIYNSINTTTYLAQIPYLREFLEETGIVRPAKPKEEKGEVINVT